MSQNSQSFPRVLRLGVMLLALLLLPAPTSVGQEAKSTDQLLPTEPLADKNFRVENPRLIRGPNNQLLSVAVWFDQQFLGDGKAYRRRAQEFTSTLRRPLRAQVIATLKDLNHKSYAQAVPALKKLAEDQVISNVESIWIVNGFTCAVAAGDLKKLRTVPGVSKVFITGKWQPQRRQMAGTDIRPSKGEAAAFAPERFRHPWYTRALMADKVWREFGITGKGTLNIIHDFNFRFPPHLKSGLHEAVGFNFVTGTKSLTVRPRDESRQALHGTMCASIICGRGTEESPFEFGIAPESNWAGVIAGTNIEKAIQWAIEQQADTYSMSFSRPNLGELRSHWRKMMEHGSFCGLYFVSGAGNFAQTEKVPVQMRTPEDIPDVVFAAAGVQRDLSRTPFSSKGPVEWKTRHYQDGTVQKPEVCAFNFALPMLSLDGSVKPYALNGNSFAGPMFCGTIALMLSADPDLLPWDLKDIITSTATDIGSEGIDFETGHGLINSYRAVKEVLRRKAIREGQDAVQFEPAEKNDVLNLDSYREALGKSKLIIGAIRSQSNAAKAGLQRGDVILQVGDTNISNESTWNAALKENRNKTVEVVVQRAGKRMKFTCKVDRNQIPRVFAVFEAPVFK